MEAKRIVMVFLAGFFFFSIPLEILLKPVIGEGVNTWFSVGIGVTAVTIVELFSYLGQKVDTEVE